jgi:hypothetical protein
VLERVTTMEEKVKTERDRRPLDPSKRPHNIRFNKVTAKIEETILDLRLTKRFR